MRELAQARPRFGYRRIDVLLLRDGWRVNIKRVRRLYRIEGLQLRLRTRRRKRASLHRSVPPAASRADERWSMDFVHDSLLDGRAFRALTVIDQCSRWSPVVEVAQSMSGGAVAEALDRAISKHGKRNTITVDHGTEFTSRALDEWAYRRGIALDFIDDARRKIEAWRMDYNLHRPHSALRQLSPAEFLKRRSNEDEEAALVLI
jgi:putative transposase